MGLFILAAGFFTQTSRIEFERLRLAAGGGLSPRGHRQHWRRLALVVVDQARLDHNGGRKLAMLICAIAVVPIGFAAQTSNLWIAVILIGVAAAAHQGWSCNLFTTTSDMFPRRAVGSVVGIGGMAGAVGGMMIARLVGEILERTGSYVPIFIIAASAYLAALLVFHLLSPKLEPANLE